MSHPTPKLFTHPASASGSQRKQRNPLGPLPSIEPSATPPGLAPSSAAPAFTTALHDSLQLILNQAYGQTQLTDPSSCALALHFWEAKEDETDRYLRRAPTAIQKLILNLSSQASLLFTVDNSCYTADVVVCLLNPV